MPSLHQQREEVMTWAKEIVLKELRRGMTWEECIQTVEKNLMHRHSFGYHARRDYILVIEDWKEYAQEKIKEEQAARDARIQNEADKVLNPK